MVTGMSWSDVVRSLLKGEGQGAETRANINSLMGFLDAFKAVAACVAGLRHPFGVWSRRFRCSGGAVGPQGWHASLTHCEDFA
jgi:hypothetical protein